MQHAFLIGLLLDASGEKQRKKNTNLQVQKISLQSRKKLHLEQIDRGSDWGEMD